MHDVSQTRSLPTEYHWTDMSSKKWSLTWITFQLLSSASGCRLISLLKCDQSTLGSCLKRFLGRKSMTLMLFLSSQLQASSLTDPFSLWFSSYLSMKSFRVSLRFSQMRLLTGETSFSFFSCSNSVRVFSQFSCTSSSSQEEVQLSWYSSSLSLLLWLRVASSLPSLLSDFLLGDQSCMLMLSSLSTLLPWTQFSGGFILPVVWLFLRWYSTLSHQEIAFSCSLKFLRFFLAQSMDRCLRRWTPLSWWLSRSISMALSRKVTLLSRQRTSICLSTSCLHLKQPFTAPQLQPPHFSRKSRQMSCARKQRKLYFLRLVSFSSFLQSIAPRLIQKAQLLQILTMKRHMVKVPNSPPMQERISSSLTQPRQICRELGDLKMKKVQQLGLSALISQRFLMAFLPTMPPETSLQSESGEMLLSVVMVQSSIMICASSPPVLEKMMQLESSRQKVRNSAISGLMSGFTKQMVKKIFWLLLAKYSSISSLLAQYLGLVGSMLVLVHWLTDTSIVFWTGEEYLPPISQSMLSGRQSQQCMFSSSNLFWMAGQPRQCSRVQGSRVQGLLLSVVSPQWQFWLMRLMSKQRSPSLRLWCQISTPNMKLTLSAPEVLSTRGAGSSAFLLVLVEVMLSILSVLSTLFEKATSSTMISTIEKAPPMKVWCSGSPWQRRNSVVLKKSHFLIPFFIFLTAFIQDNKNYTLPSTFLHKQASVHSDWRCCILQDQYFWVMSGLLGRVAG